MSEIRTGAHGLVLAGMRRTTWLGVSAAQGWPEVTVRPAPHASAQRRWTADLSAGSVAVRSDVDHADLVHPLLGAIGSAFALARGDDAMHAGAVLGAAGAWGLIGSKRAGKSTLLAALASRGVEVLTDDVLVLSGARALAGPRCIDLRIDAGRSGEGVVLIRGGERRRRVELPPIAGEHSLRGLIHLEWSDGNPSVLPIGRRESLRRVIDLRSEKGYPRNPVTVLELTAMRGYVLRRPRSWAALDAGVAAVCDLIGAGDDPGALVDARP